MKNRINYIVIITVLAILACTVTFAQTTTDNGLLTIDRIYSSEFNQDYQMPIQWIENGNAYITIEPSTNVNGGYDLVRNESKSQKSSIYISASSLTVNGKSLYIENFSLSQDGSKVLIFTNSKRVWRSNTKGDYWVYDFNTQKLKQIGQKFEASSLMFAKFSIDNKLVAYVHNFNIYTEDFVTENITQLTFDGTDKIINGTFDWVYEEEFGKRDGFSWNPNAKYIAYWHLDASGIGTFNMINNTDSVYSKLIPIQYPKVGQAPSATKIGIVDISRQETIWIPLPGDEKQHYIPGMQWLNKDILLLQQMNRKQNELIVWSYSVSTKELKKIYTENEDTWIDLNYPDISSNTWGNNDLPIVDGGTAFLRMTENDKWRHVYKINIASGQKTLITTGGFDVASVSRITDKLLYFIASPNNSTERYLYSIDINGNSKQIRLTPEKYKGVNTYNISPNGKYSFHTHKSVKDVRTVRFVSLPSHKTISTLIDNELYKKKLEGLELPEIEFFTVTTEEGVDIDGRMILPIGFDKTKKYPVLFHVYGEPWTQVATNTPVGLWNIFLAQKGYVIIDMDNRGTPCLKGSEWRKSIYRKIGVLNTDDQAKAAKKILQRPYLDEKRVAVWGWSGGGSMTLNLMFRYPEIYQTGMAVAAVTNQLTYDNIYQERYMGLPQENMSDFIDGSPITYAKNLQGNLLVIHGTGDDNVHYQGAEMLINELIKHNKQFSFMPYPNRSHGIYEGANTRRHLYTLLTNYILKNTPINKK